MKKCETKKVNCVIWPNFRFGTLASLKTFYWGKGLNRHFFVWCRGRFRSVGPKRVGPLRCLRSNSSNLWLTYFYSCPCSSMQIYPPSERRHVKVKQKSKTVVINFLSGLQLLQLSISFHGTSPKEAGEFWWTYVKWRRPFILGAAILEYNERNFFFG